LGSKFVLNYFFKQKKKTHKNKNSFAGFQICLDTKKKQHKKTATKKQQNIYTKMFEVIW
jgi:hypothetical protein